MRFCAQQRWEHFIYSVSSTKSSGNHHQQNMRYLKHDTFLDRGMVIIAALWEMNPGQISFSLSPHSTIWLCTDISSSGPCPFFPPSWEMFPASWLPRRSPGVACEAVEVCPGHSCRTTENWSQKRPAWKKSGSRSGGQQWWRLQFGLWCPREVNPAV